MEAKSNVLLIPKDEVWKNPNTDYEIPIEVQKRFMNGNAQFLMDLAVNLKISYSITSLAIQLCHYFFYKKRYVNYDRFIVAASCMLLALKLKDTDGAKMKSVCAAYHKTIAKVENKEKIEIMDEEIYNKIKEKIIVHESKLLKVIDFTLDIPLPYPYVEKILTRYFKDDREKDKQLYHLSRVFILDIYRTHICLIYPASVIAMTGIILAASLLNYQLPPNLKEVKVNINELSEEKKKELQDQCFERWVQEVDPDTKCTEITECLKIFNELMETYSDISNST
jgi:hypothetical protein